MDGLTMERVNGAGEWSWWIKKDGFAWAVLGVGES
jgi:hypothetical protein